MNPDPPATDEYNLNDQPSMAEITNGYPGVYEFVSDYLSKVYSRQVTDINDTVWCPEWWRHAEAAIRLTALWQAWEYYRLKGGQGMSLWFLQHADPHMAKLLDPRGPFKYCSVRNGHRDMLEPLPLETPDGPDRRMFDDVEIDEVWRKGRPYDD